MIVFVLKDWQRKNEITFCGLHHLFWLWTVLHGEKPEKCLHLGRNPGRHCAFMMAGVQPFIITHHPNQSWVGFSLFYCHLDHWTLMLLRQHHHGNTVGDCAALPVGPRHKRIRWWRGLYINVSLSKGIIRHTLVVFGISWFCKEAQKNNDVWTYWWKTKQKQDCKISV